VPGRWRRLTWPGIEPAPPGRQPPWRPGGSGDGRTDLRDITMLWAFAPPCAGRLLPERRREIRVGLPEPHQSGHRPHQCPPGGAAAPGAVGPARPLFTLPFSPHLPFPRSSRAKPTLSSSWSSTSVRSREAADGKRGHRSARGGSRMAQENTLPLSLSPWRAHAVVRGV
jgi:hypothetical protein